MKISKTQKQILIGSAIGALGVASVVTPIVVSLTTSKIEFWPRYASDDDIKNGISISTYKDMKAQFQAKYKAHLVDDLWIEDPKTIEKEMKRVSQAIDAFDQSFVSRQNGDGQRIDYTILTESFGDMVYDFTDINNKKCEIKLSRPSNSSWKDAFNLFEENCYAMETEMRRQGLGEKVIQDQIDAAWNNFYNIYDTLSNRYPNDTLSGVTQAESQILTCFDGLLKSNALKAAGMKLNDFLNNYVVMPRPNVTLANDAFVDENGNVKKLGTQLTTDEINEAFQFIKKDNNQPVLFDPLKMVPGDFEIKASLFDRYFDSNTREKAEAAGITDQADLNNYGTSSHDSNNSVVCIDWMCTDNNFLKKNKDKNVDPEEVTAHVMKPTEKTLENDDDLKLLSSSNGSDGSISIGEVDEFATKKAKKTDIQPQIYSLTPIKGTETGEGELGIENNAMEIGNSYFSTGKTGADTEIVFGFPETDPYPTEDDSWYRTDSATGKKELVKIWPAPTENFYAKIDRKDLFVDPVDGETYLYGIMDEDLLVNSGLYYKYAGEEKWRFLKPEYDRISAIVNSDNPDQLDVDSSPIAKFFTNCSLFAIVKAPEETSGPITVNLCVKYSNTAYCAVPQWNTAENYSAEFDPNNPKPIQIDAKTHESGKEAEAKKEENEAYEYFCGYGNYIGKPRTSSTTGFKEKNLQLVLSEKQHALSEQLFETCAKNFNKWNTKLSGILDFDKWSQRIESDRCLQMSQYFIDFAIDAAGTVCIGIDIWKGIWMCNWSQIARGVLLAIFIAAKVTVVGLQIAQLIKTVQLPLIEVEKMVNNARGTAGYSDVVAALKDGQKVFPLWNPSSFNFESKPYSNNFKDSYKAFITTISNMKFFEVKDRYIDKFSDGDGTIFAKYEKATKEAGCSPEIINAYISKNTAKNPKIEIAAGVLTALYSVELQFMKLADKLDKKGLKEANLFDTNTHVNMANTIINIASALWKMTSRTLSQVFPSYNS